MIHERYPGSDVSPISFLVLSPQGQEDFEY